MKKSVKKKSVVKKTTKKKTMSKKAEKPKQLTASAAAKQDIIGLLSMLVEKLASFESKLDLVLNRVTIQPAVSAPKPPAPVPPKVISPLLNKPAKPAREMFKAVCADCGKDCEVPFKPREDRPVYCKDCFSKRKAKGVFRPQVINEPREEPSAKTTIAAKPKKAKPVKSISKKKPASRVPAVSGQRRGLADSSIKEGSRRTEKKKKTRK